MSRMDAITLKQLRALAAIDLARPSKTKEYPLKGHPESIQLEQKGSRIFVNVPDAGEIAGPDPDPERS